MPNSVGGTDSVGGTESIPSLFWKRNCGIKPGGVSSVAWSNHSSSQSGVAVEIPTGEGRFRPLQLLLPSSKRKSDTWDSRSKHVPVQWRYGIGASGIRTGATYRNGCLRSGESLWNPTSVEQRDPPVKPALLAWDWPSARNIVPFLIYSPGIWLPTPAFLDLLSSLAEVSPQFR